MKKYKLTNTDIYIKELEEMLQKDIDIIRPIHKATWNNEARELLTKRKNTNEL